MRYILIVILYITGICSAKAQNTHSLFGEVRDKHTDELIPGALVSIKPMNINLQTDEEGHFHLINLVSREYVISVSMLGYTTLHEHVELKGKTHLVFLLDNSDVDLQEITVTLDDRQGLHKKSTNISYKQSGIIDIASPNFTKVLTSIAGINSMDIGSGISKPIIRGLGFNRIAVIDRGIIQQNQQWGADHGIEINQFDIDNVIVHKGPRSLEFGSDAMAGAIEISADKPEGKNKYAGELVLYGASNNDMAGFAFKNELKHNKWYLNLVANVQSYGDYRVPADEFTYLSYVFPIYNRRLKNTAGRENNFAGTVRYDSHNFFTSFNISNNYQKAGFFPGAHGIPDLSAMQPDDSSRNVDLPYSTANHFRIINNTQFKLPIGRLLINSGYQENHRQENSYFHSHYPDQQEPVDDPNLELDFRLKTSSVNAHLYMGEAANWQKTVGVSSEIQQNRIAGYGFLMPRFEQFAYGLYSIHTFPINTQWEFTGGMRYDIAKTDITGFYDSVLADYLLKQGYSPSEVAINAQRAYDITRNFGSFSGSVGVNYRPYNNNSRWKATLGKSFRFPTANELSSNGIHHGAFRHEEGNPNLDPEEGYTLDIDYAFVKNDFRLEASPFLTYFSNYIYLNPQAEFSILPGGGQKYKYMQAEARFAGAEYTLNWDFWQYNRAKLSYLSKGSYVYNHNITTGYPLPFTPPLVLSNELAYSKSTPFQPIRFYRFVVEHKYYAKQSRIIQNEETTPQTSLFNLSAGVDYKWNKFLIQLNLQVQNLFDTQYMNHLSFYRKLNMLEPGRNIQLFVRIPFNK
ncbi:MAG: hypothetical protein RL662_1620 [Bacteroidota bacterium]|jgi:iron complex outermembrane receptor protein